MRINDRVCYVHVSLLRLYDRARFDKPSIT